MKNLSFTCPKLAVALIIRIIAGLIFCGIAIFVCNDILIFSIPFIISFIGMAIITCISLYNFSFAVFRSFIVLKFDNEGIKTAFCKINYDEFTNVGYENVEFISSRGRDKKFGILLIINGGDKTLKTHDIKKSICIPLNDKTKQAFIKYAPQVAEKFNIV